MSFFKSLEKGISNAASDLTREVGHITRDVERGVDSVRSSPILDLFKQGNVLQLVSRASGKALQIVTAPNGTLVVDGRGPEGPTFMHAHWTVVAEGNNIVRLHNTTNFLAIVNGATMVGSFPMPSTAGPETRFRVGTKDNFVMFESMKEIGRHIGIQQGGDLKSALATGKEADAQFGVKLIYEPPKVQAAIVPGNRTVLVTTVTKKN